MKFVAHGGYSAKYPENTLESYIAAAEFNPFAIEADVVSHPDTGELICFHPEGISSDQGTYTPENIRSQINSGAEQPVTLKVVLNKLPTQKILVDFKQDVLGVLDRITELDLSRVFIGARGIDSFSIIKSKIPANNILYLTKNPMDYADFANAGGKHYRLWEHDVTLDVVNQIHGLGLMLWVTPGAKATPNQPRTSGEVTLQKAREFSDMGVDVLLVNDISMKDKL